MKKYIILLIFLLPCILFSQETKLHISQLHQSGSLSGQTPIWNGSIFLPGYYDYNNLLNTPTVIAGTGTANYISKWTSSSVLDDSNIYDDGVNNIFFKDRNLLFEHAGNNRWIYTDGNAANTKELKIQAGAGSAGFGGGLAMYGHSHATKPGWVTAGISSDSGGKFSVNTHGTGTGTNVFTVDSNGDSYIAGDLGIGVTSPIGRLQVGDYSSGTAEATYPGDIVLQRPQTSSQAVGGIEFKLSNSSAGYGWKISALNDAAVGLAFANRSSSADWSDKMYIEASGNVGLGLTSPTARLHIKGAGATNSTSSFLAENSVGTELFQIKDNGDVDIEGFLFLPNRTGTATKLGGWTAANKCADITIGSGLSLSSGTLSSTALLSETNDLSSVVIWANVPDANITQSSVTQHQAALTITESQISDLSHTVNTDNQTIDVFSFDDTNNEIDLSLSGDGEATKTLDISGVLTGTTRTLSGTSNVSILSSGDIDVSAATDISFVHLASEKILINANGVTLSNAATNTTSNEYIVQDETTGNLEVRTRVDSVFVLREVAEGLDAIPAPAVIAKGWYRVPQHLDGYTLDDVTYTVYQPGTSGSMGVRLDINFATSTDGAGTFNATDTNVNAACNTVVSEGDIIQLEVTSYTFSIIDALGLNYELIFTLE